MATVYSSDFEGEEIDKAVSIVLGSKVTASELSVLHTVTAGEASPLKVLLTDSSNNIKNINVLGSQFVETKQIIFALKTIDPSDSPSIGNIFVYFKEGNAYTKNSSGVVKKLGGGSEKVFEFTDVTTVVCIHDLDNRYPIVDIYDTTGLKIEGQVLSFDVNTTVVSFNNQRSGVVIIRLTI
jgi:hypothetical protein